MKHDFNEAINRIVDATESLDCAVIGEMTQEKDGTLLEGKVLEFKGNRLMTYGNPDMAFMNVHIEHSILHDIILNEESIETENQDLSNFPFEVPDELGRQAVSIFDTLTENKSNSDGLKYRVSLSRLLESNKTEFQIKERNHQPHGFAVITRIYPYQDGFGVPELSDALMAVNNKANLGKNSIRIRLNYLAQQFEAKQGEDTPGYSPGFQ